MGLFFDDIMEGDVFSFGASALTADDVAEFRRRFAPPLPMHASESDGEAPPDAEAAAQAHVYALWSRMLYEFTFDWPIIARIGQDQLRWYKTARVGDTLSVRITFLTKDPVDAMKGVVATQHDVLNQNGELIMALLTRTAVARRRPTDEE